jgi:hypothetical protein
LEELNPQVKVLLDQLSAGASQAPALSMTEKIAATRQRTGALAAFGFPSEPVSKVSDLDIPGPYGQIQSVYMFQIWARLIRDRWQSSSTIMGEVLLRVI